MKKTEKSAPAEAFSPRKEGFLPMLLTAVCLFITLAATVIDKFFYPFGGDMLSPALGQIIVLLLPAYLCMMLLSPEKTPAEQLKVLGIGKLHAEYVFFMIFAAMFTVTSSLLLNMIFGGVYSAAEGFTLLSCFTAGENEYAVNYVYLVLVYALIPALIEEAVFRGLIYGELRRVSTPSAIALSSVIFALFSFRLGGFVAALFCGLAYCFILMTTGSLQACMIVHFVYNLYALMLETNISAYFLSSQNNTLLLIVIIAAWLISGALFFTESARLYKIKAEKVVAGEKKSGIPAFRFSTLLRQLKAIFSFRPTLLCGVACLVLYIAIMVVHAIV